MSKNSADSFGGEQRPNPARETGLIAATARVVMPVAAAGAGLWLAWRLLRRVRAFDFKDKCVLITGGSRGLGLVLARELVRQGAHVAICARDSAELDRAFDDLKSRGATALLAIRSDIAKPGEARAAAEAVLSRWGRIDVLMNNAGTMSVGPMETMTPEDYQAAMRINFWGPLNMINAVLPAMRQRGEGRIVNISSVGGKVSFPHLLPYNASKFALVGLSEGLHAELAKDGIVVTTVCPGLMRTGSPRNAAFKGHHRAEYAWFSISDSLPVLSMSAETAAAKIIAACRRGDAEIVLSLPAKLAVAFHNLFPELAAQVFALVNRLLPPPGGAGSAQLTGKESASTLAPSWLTRLSDWAALQNNQMNRDEMGNGRHSDGKAGPL
jgi:NAD(P)-dependent dehydrogenase (short-subunit alcohol dehydrogenase family)